jgi:MFS family permease
MEESKKRIEFWKSAIPFAAVYAVVWGVAGISLPLIAKSAHRAGLVFAMLNLGVGVAAPFWGHLSRRASVSGLVFASTLLAGVSWLMITLLGNVLLPVMALVFGLFASGIFALATVQVTKILPKEEWDTFIARMQSVMTGGQVIGLLATSLYAGPALGLPFLVVGILGGAVVARGAIRRGIGDIEHLHFGHLTPSTIFPGILHGHYQVHFRPRHLVHFRHPLLAVVLVRWTLLLLAWAPVYAIYPLMMKNAFGFAGASSSILYSASTAVTVILFIAAGAIAKRRTPEVSMTIGAVVSTLAFALMYLSPSLRSTPVGGVGFVLMVSSYAFVGVGMNDGVVSIVSEQQEGEALGVANALMSADNVVGGIAGGVLVSALGYSALFVVGFLLSLLALGAGVMGNMMKARAGGKAAGAGA